MNFFWRLFIKLKGMNKKNNCRSEAEKYHSDSANEMYESFEYGHRYTKQEVSSGICQMKHRNEL